MPEIFRKAEANFLLSIWKSIEAIETLKEAAELSAKEKELFEQLKSITRKREWLTVRVLLNNLLPGSAHKIKYDDNGKPFLHDGISISISHTHEFIALLICQGKTAGVDIETIDKRILTLSRKFLSANELATLPDQNLTEHLQIIWGAKEVLYKIYSRKGLDFKNHLKTGPFNFSLKGELFAELCVNGTDAKYKIHFEKVENMMLTWAAE
jgi:4'-phosphopantetheinyl transferase